MNTALLFALIAVAVCYNASAPLLSDRWNADLTVFEIVPKQEKISFPGHFQADYTKDITVGHFTDIPVANTTVEVVQWRHPKDFDFARAAIRQGEHGAFECSMDSVVNMAINQDILRAIPFNRVWRSPSGHLIDLYIDSTAEKHLIVAAHHNTAEITGITRRWVKSGQELVIMFKGWATTDGFRDEDWDAKHYCPGM